MYSIEEAESEDLGEDLSITLAELGGVIKKSPGSKAPVMYESRPEMLKALGQTGVVVPN